MHSVSLRRTFVGLYRGDLSLWLAGDSVTTLVTDWSFTDAVQTVQIETRTWYFIPHFVRTFIARDDAQLYLFSEYFAPAPGQPDLRDHFPEARFWNRMVVRDPRIRVKIGNRLFNMRAYPVTDPSGNAAARQAFLSKYADVGKQQESPESRRPNCISFAWSQDGMTDRQIGVLSGVSWCRAPQPGNYNQPSRVFLIELRNPRAIGEGPGGTFEQYKSLPRIDASSFAFRLLVPTEAFSC